MIPAVTRDVLDAIRRDLAESGGWAPYAELKLSWANDVLIVDDDDQTLEFVPGPDGLYEVGRLGPAGAPSQWVEVDPPLPDGPIDADTALDLLSRVRKRHPTQDLILGRPDLEALRAARARATEEAVRDALDDEISERTDGQTRRLPAPAGARHLRRPRLRCRVPGGLRRSRSRGDPRGGARRRRARPRAARRRARPGGQGRARGGARTTRSRARDPRTGRAPGRPATAASACRRPGRSARCAPSRRRLAGHG